MTFALAFGPPIVADLGTVTTALPPPPAVSHWALWAERLKPIAPIPATR